MRHAPGFEVLCGARSGIGSLLFYVEASLMPDDSIGVAGGGPVPVAVDTINGNHHQRVKVQHGADGTAQDVDAGHPLPVVDVTGASQTTLAAVLAKLTADPATQTTLAAVLAALGGTVVTAPATSGDVSSTLSDGRKVVTTHGTAVALRASLACRWVCVTAFKENTSLIFVGGSAVLAAIGSQVGVPLAAGESVTIPVANASTVFIDSRVDGEGVSFLVGV